MPIWVRLTVDGKRAELSTGKKISPEKWNVNSGKVKGNNEEARIINNYLNQVEAAIWMESAVHIQRSVGLQRGKNDKIDAKRIALYAYKNRDDIKI